MTLVAKLIPQHRVYGQVHAVQIKGHIAIAVIRNGIEVAQESRCETALSVLGTP